MQPQTQARLVQIQKEYNESIVGIQTVAKEQQKLIRVRNNCALMEDENLTVKKELDLLESDAKVYKLIGPILVAQDLPEAKQFVEKRLEKFTSEKQRVDKSLKELDDKGEGYKKKLMNIQRWIEQNAGSFK